MLYSITRSKSYEGLEREDVKRRFLNDDKLVGKLQRQDAIVVCVCKVMQPRS